MKKLFSFFAILAMALTMASASTVTFNIEDFSGNGTNRLSATKSGVTLYIYNSTSVITMDEKIIYFGKEWNKITATGSNILIKSLTYNGTKPETGEPVATTETGTGPWEWPATSMGKGPGGYTNSFTVEYEAADGPVAPTFSDTKTRYLTEASVTIVRPYDGAEVRYTTDGTEPTVSSQLLATDGVLSIDKVGTYTIKAATVKDGILSDVISLDIEVIMPQISVANIPAKYEGWSATVFCFCSSEEKLKNDIPQEIEFYTEDASLYFYECSTWKAFYEKTSKKIGIQVVKGNKFDIDLPYTKYEAGYFAICFLKDGMTSGSEYEILTSDKVTVDENGLFTVNSLSAEPFTTGKLRSDDEEAVISEDEAAIAAIMGSTVYSNELMQNRTYVNRQGQLVYTLLSGEGYVSVIMSSYYTFAKDGDNYVATYKFEEPAYIRFIVENGTVVRIEFYYEEELTITLFPSTEFTIAALMRASQYKADNDEFFYVGEGGRIMMADGTNEPVLMSESYTFSLNGDVYVAENSDGAVVKFYVENNKVTKIEEFVDGELENTYLPPLADIVAKLMGTTKYLIVFGYSIHVDEEGGIVYDYGDGNTWSFGNYYIFSIDDSGNYVANPIYPSDTYSYIFIVNNNVVTEVDRLENGELDYIYLPDQMPTAIGTPQAQKAKKSYKTIENGRIVIINDGVRYDLSGSVIK